MTGVEFDTLADGLVHPEGVAWDPDGECLYAGGEGGEIYRISLEGRVEELGSSDGSMLGLAVDGRGMVYACDDGRGEVVRFDPDALSFESYSRGSPDIPFQTPNAAAFDPEGNLYVTSSDNGLIFRVAPSGETFVWSERAPEYPNGCALARDPEDEDGERLALYVAESAASRIVRIPILPGGSPGDPVTVAVLDRMVPDGLAFDLSGDLYVACYRPDRIVRVSQDGAVDIVFDDWGAHTLDAPTNIAFVGSKLERAAVACVGDRFVAIGDLGTFGASLCYPELD
jgi:sugar lactone lactonase YvrE